jgi:hypothetical protein
VRKDQLQMELVRVGAAAATATVVDPRSTARRVSSSLHAGQGHSILRRIYYPHSSLLPPRFYTDLLGIQIRTVLSSNVELNAAAKS